MNAGKKKLMIGCSTMDKNSTKVSGLVVSARKQRVITQFCVLVAINETIKDVLMRKEI